MELCPAYTFSKGNYLVGKFLTGDGFTGLATYGCCKGTKKPTKATKFLSSFLSFVHALTYFFQNKQA